MKSVSVKGDGIERTILGKAHRFRSLAAHDLEAGLKVLANEHCFSLRKARVVHNWLSGTFSAQITVSNGATAAKIAWVWS